MLVGMFPGLKRVALFTALMVLMLTVGCGGTYQEPNTPEAYAEAEDDVAAEPVGTTPAVATTVDYSQTDYYEDSDPRAVTDFHDELSPYGAWVEDSTYGLVWVPNAQAVGPDFAPYVSAGHWAMTDGGDWLWVSDYSWGWVTFHYGRWIWIPGRGWAWIAGRRYAPSWVVWRTGYDDYGYVGWAPMPPLWYWSGGVAVAFWVVPPAPYVFCPSAYVFSPHVHGYIAHGPEVGAIAQRTRPYHPASAGTGGGHGPSAPGLNGAHQFANPSRGPTLADAHVPPSAAPKSFAKPEAKALAAAAPKGGSPMHGTGPSHAGRTGPAARPTPRTTMGPAVSRPVYRGYQPAPSGPQPYAGGRPAPYTGGVRPSYGGSGPSRVNPGYSSHGASPSPYRSTPAPTYRSTPGPTYRSSPGPTFRSSPGPSYRPAPAPAARPSSKPSGGGGHRRR